VARLIEIRGEDSIPAALTLAVGDVLMVGAAGAQVRDGPDVVDMLGAFVPGSVARSGEVLSPQGAPSMVLFRATGAGAATLELISGDPFHSTRRHTLELTVGG
jgi:hypothetical protein